MRVQSYRGQGQGQGLTSRPSSLAITKANLVLVVSGNVLDVVHGLRHVIKVGVGGIVDVLALPVGESVGQQVGHAALDDGVGRAVVELVPAVDRADLDVVEGLLDLLDPLQQLVGRQGPPVQTLGANRDGTHDVFVPGHGRVEGLEVLVERFFRVGPSNTTLGLIVQLEWNVRSDSFDLTPLNWSQGGERHIPDSQNHLEALLLGGGNDVLGRVAVTGRVGANQRRQVLQRVKVLFEILGALAAAVCVLVPQSESEHSGVLVEGQSRHGGQQE